MKMEGWKTQFLVLSILLLVSISSSHSVDRYQLNPKLSVSTDQRAYNGNTTITVSGTLTEVQGDVIIVITNPSGSAIASSYGQVDEYSGIYAVDFNAGGPGWAESGRYNVTVTWQFCPLTVSNATSFTYAAAALTLKAQVAYSTRLTATTTNCDSATQSTIESGSTAVASRSAGGEIFPNTPLFGVGVAAVVVILLTALIIGSIWRREK